MLQRFKGHWAVVTGGGDGIGRALCLALADCGVNIAVQDIRGDAASTVADQVKAKGVATHIMTFDVADAKATNEAAAEFDDEIGAPAVLCANAGVLRGSFS